MFIPSVWYHSSSSNPASLLVKYTFFNSYFLNLIIRGAFKTQMPTLLLQSSSKYHHHDCYAAQWLIKTYSYSFFGGHDLALGHIIRSSFFCSTFTHNSKTVFRFSVRFIVREYCILKIATIWSIHPVLILEFKKRFWKILSSISWDTLYISRKFLDIWKFLVWTILFSDILDLTSKYGLIFQI